MVSLLLSRGANINAFDKKDRRAIHWAAYMGMYVFAVVYYSGSKKKKSDQLNFGTNFKRRAVEIIPLSCLLLIILAYCFIILSSQVERVKAVAAVFYESTRLGISLNMSCRTKTLKYVISHAC